MADYGLKVFDSGGNVVLDVSDKITRFRYGNEVSAGASSNTTLSDINGLSSVELSIAINPSYPANFAAHLVARSGTTITWTEQSGDSYVSIDSLIFVFLYT